MDRSAATSEPPSGRDRPEPHQERDGRPVQLLLAAALLVAAMLMAHHPMILSGFARVQTDPGDTRLNNYLLEHTWRVLTGAAGARGLWDPPSFHPLGNAGALADMLLAVAPPYWLWRLVGFAPDTAFQLWMLSITTLNWGAFLLLARKGLGLRLVPAALGAVLFAAGSGRVAQMGHQQMVCHVWPALAFLALARLFAGVDRAPDPPAGESAAARPNRRRAAAWLGLLFGSVAAQFWGGIYNAFFLCLLLGLTAALGACFGPVRRRGWELLRRHWPEALALAALAALAVLPVYLHYSRAAALCGERSWSLVSRMVPHPQSWLFLGEWNWALGGAARWWPFSGLRNPGEHAVGLGLLTAAMAAVGLCGRRGRAGVRLTVAVTAVAVILTTCWGGGLTGWRVVHFAVPGAAGLRAVVRIGLFLLFPAAIGLAAFLEDRGRRAVWWTAPLALLCLLEQGQTTPAYDKALVRSQVAEAVARVDRRAEAFYLAAQPARPERELRTHLHLDALWAALATGVPTVNGYAGIWPASFGALWERNCVADEAALADLEAALATWAGANGLRREGLQLILLDPITRHPEASRILAAELPAELRSGSAAVVMVTVENCGRTVWQPVRRYRIKLGARLRPAGEEEEPPRLEARARFEGPVAPGQILRLPMRLDLSKVPPGRYMVVFDVVRENRYWFEQHGSRTLRHEVEVLPPADRPPTPATTAGADGHAGVADIHAGNVRLLDGWQALEFDGGGVFRSCVGRASILILRDRRDRDKLVIDLDAPFPSGERILAVRSRSSGQQVDLALVPCRRRYVQDLPGDAPCTLDLAVSTPPGTAGTAADNDNRAMKRARELGVSMPEDTNRDFLLPEGPNGHSTAEPANAEASRGHRGPAPRECPYVWREMMITTNGLVRPCCFAGSETLLGQLGEGLTLSEIWNSDAARTCRRILANNRLPPGCQGRACIYARYSEQHASAGHDARPGG